MTPSTNDQRRSHLSLTATGKKRFAQLSRRADQEVRTILKNLSSSEKSRMIRAMSLIQQLLGDPLKGTSSFFLRTHQAGDMGWVVHSHAVLYSNEHGYNEQYEATVAEIVASFLRNSDPKRERCWIAEKDAANVGSVFCVKENELVARLRLLLVEPGARGLGIGTELVRACVNFARQARYRKIILWTQSDLLEARKIYKKAGFRCVRKMRHNSWGRPLTGETWELQLTDH